MKTHISDRLSRLDQEVVNGQIRWEFLKYEIRQFIKKFSRAISHKARIEREKLKQELKLFQ